MLPTKLLTSENKHMKGSGHSWERFDLSHAFTADELSTTTTATTAISDAKTKSASRGDADDKQRRLAILSALEDDTSESIEQSSSYRRVAMPSAIPQSKREADDSHFAAIFGSAGYETLERVEADRGVKQLMRMEEEEKRKKALAPSGFAVLTASSSAAAATTDDSLVAASLSSGGASSWKQRRKQMLAASSSDSTTKPSS